MKTEKLFTYWMNILNLLNSNLCLFININIDCMIFLWHVPHLKFIPIAFQTRHGNSARSSNLTQVINRLRKIYTHLRQYVTGGITSRSRTELPQLNTQGGDIIVLTIIVISFIIVMVLLFTIAIFIDYKHRWVIIPNCLRYFPE